MEARGEKHGVSSSVAKRLRSLQPHQVDMTPASIRHLIRALNEPPRILYDPHMITGKEVAALSLSRPGDLVPVVHGESLRVIPQRTITIRIGASTPRATAAMGPTLRGRRHS